MPKLIEHEHRGIKDGGQVRRYIGFERLFLDIIKRNKISTKKTIEIGCGRGTFMELLKENGIDAIRLYKVHEFGKEPNIMECMQTGRIDMTINIPLPTTDEEKFRRIIEDEFKIRRMAVDYNVPVIINIQLAKAIIDANENVREKPLVVKSLEEFHKELKEIYWWHNKK